MKKFNKDEHLDLNIQDYIFGFIMFCETFAIDYTNKDIKKLLDYYCDKNLELI